jgi:hypothetical protein
MSVLLIGGDSYVGRSITSKFESKGIHVSSFSSKKKFTHYSYDDFDNKFLESHNFAVVIGTPGHFGTQNGLSNNSKILLSLSNSKLNIYAISTIHTLGQKTDNENEYVCLNRNFEEIALLNNFRVIRIPNFIGLIPAKSDSQSRLLPWSLLENFVTHGYLQINSNLESEFEWVTSTDLVDCILNLEKNNDLKNVELQPGYKCTLGYLVQTFSEFVAAKQNLQVRVQIMDHENHRKVICGQNPMGSVGWKTELTGKILQSYLQEYLHKNWSHYA